MLLGLLTFACRSSSPVESPQAEPAHPPEASASAEPEAPAPAEPEAPAPEPAAAAAPEAASAEPTAQAPAPAPADPSEAEDSAAAFAAIGARDGHRQEDPAQVAQSEGADAPAAGAAAEPAGAAAAGSESSDPTYTADVDLPSERTPVPSSATGGTDSDLAATMVDARQGLLHGSISSFYRGRSTSGESDHDLYGVLSLDVGDPEKDRWTGFLLGRVAADLDGQGSGPDPFFDLSDTEGAAVDLRLYEAWAEGHGIGPLERLRIGRQTLWETPVDLAFDGLYAETKPLSGKSELRFGGYGGIPYYVYESSRSDDVLVGLFAEARPWERGRVRVDWFHVSEDGRFGDHANDLFGIHLWQQLSQTFGAEAAYTRLEDRDRDLRLVANWADLADDLVVRAEYYELLEKQNDLALDVDPFTALLFEQFPYRQVRLSASKQFGEHFGAQLGYDLRRVSDEDDVGEFNRDFDRGFLTTTWSEVWKGIDLSLTGEQWDSEQNDVGSYGFDVTKHLKTATASVGTYFSLYKIDILNQEERENVRSYYLRYRRKISESLTWDARYEYENADVEDFHTLKLGLSWRF